MSGRDAQRGFIFQSIIAMIECLDRDDWDEVKLEPDTALDKVDISLYKDGDIILSIQVKSSQNKYERSKVKKWLESIKKDAAGAREIYLCLVGDCFSVTCESYISQNSSEIRKVSFRNLEETCTGKLAMYIKKVGLGDSVRVEDLDLIDASLFSKIHKNSITQNRMTRSAFEKAFLQAVPIYNTSRASYKTPEYYATELRCKSQNVFNANKDYERDLLMSKLDPVNKTVVKKALLKKDYPDVIIGETESTRCNLFDYLDAHIDDMDTKRNILISGISGGGKTVYLYGIWKEYLKSNPKYIPIYIPLFIIDDSIKQYIESHYLYSAVGGKCSYDEFVYGLFKETSYRFIFLLDGYNELVDHSGEKGEKLSEEIDEFINTDCITVIITSRSPELEFNNSVTRIKMCSLRIDQIQDALGGEKLPKDFRYEGILDNPFILKRSIEAFSNAGDVFTKIMQSPLEKTLQYYILKQKGDMKDQVKRNKISTKHRVYIDVILPLITLELDKRGENEEIREDTRVYDWGLFENAVITVCKRIEEYSRNIHVCMGRESGFQNQINYIHKKAEEGDLTTELLDTGVSLRFFSSESISGIKIVWKHEIYRDYFTARGYALYSSAQKDAEDIVYNLARQVNYRYPEPGVENTKVEPFIREYHVRKAQMYIDMVDERLKYHEEFDTDNLAYLKTTAVYRRLVRDVAFIYEDLDDPNLARAEELCMHYYYDNLNNYKKTSKYDYDSEERRYADTAYTLCGLGYCFTHLRFAPDKKTKEEYLGKAWNNLNIAEQIFRGLSEEALSNETVQSDILKVNGNRAAYYVAMQDITEDEDKKRDYLREAWDLHYGNLKNRIKKRDEINKAGGKTDMINRDIGASYYGLATSCFYLGKYDEREYINAIDYCKSAIEAYPKNEHEFISRGYRKMVGAYAEIKGDSSEPFETNDMLLWIKKALTFVMRKKRYKDFEKLRNNIEIIKSSLSEEQQECHRKEIDEIDTLLYSINDNVNSYARSRL